MCGATLCRPSDNSVFQHHGSVVKYSALSGSHVEVVAVGSCSNPQADARGRAALSGVGYAADSCSSPYRFPLSGVAATSLEKSDNGIGEDQRERHNDRDRDAEKRDMIDFGTWYLACGTFEIARSALESTVDQRRNPTHRCLALLNGRAIRVRRATACTQITVPARLGQRACAQKCAQKCSGNH